MWCIIPTTMRRFLFLTVLLCLAAAGLWAAAPVTAAPSSASEMIAAVNALRAEYGLEPYGTDAELNALAQAHSEYQASIQKITHTRADGSGPAEAGVIENIGGGMNVGAEYIVRQQWADYWHRKTLIGFVSASAGAGVAERDGVVYYTFVIRGWGKETGAQETEAAVPAPGTAGTPSQSDGAPTFDPQSAFTVTPQEDGSVIHAVRAGETVWSIALIYDIASESIVALNGLNATQPVIYEGQRLLLRPAFTVTPTASPTVTPLPPTATLKPTRTLRPPRPTRTPGPLQTEDVPQRPPLSGRQVALIAVLVVGIAAYIGVTFGIKDKK